MADTTVYRDPDPSLVTVCQVTYALHALGLAIGAFGAATVVGSFLFWFALLWACLIGLAGMVLLIVIVGIGVWIIGLFVLGIWAIYRIARGWMRLNARQAIA